MNITAITKGVSKVAGRTGLQLAKASPEILTVAGIVGIVVSTVLACRATLKVEDVIEDYNERNDAIEEWNDKAKEDAKLREKYSEEDYKRDRVINYAKTAGDFVKLYGPSVALGVASVAAILVGHNILRKRNLALVAAYNGVAEAFKAYRKRVVEKYGEDQDKQFRYGTHKETVSEKVTGEDGKTKTVKKEIDVLDDMPSQYARVFDERSTEWCKDNQHNLSFLIIQQNLANDMLRSRGHLFLNEVFDLLGLKRNSAGAVVGWVFDREQQSKVDFGIFNVNAEGYASAKDAYFMDIPNDTLGQQCADFVNGYTNRILLDFNVDGVIYDLI